MHRSLRLGLLLLPAIDALILANCNGAAGQEPDILFLRPDEAGRVRLYRQAGPAAVARPLSTAPGGISIASRTSRADSVPLLAALTEIAA